MRLLTLAVLLLTSPALAAIDDIDTCEKLARRYERRCGATPTPTPRPTPPSRPCEKVGDSWSVDFQLGDEHLYCFDIPATTPKPGTFGNPAVEVNGQNRGNVSCAQLQSTLISPTGETFDALGAQAGGTIRGRTPGRWYFWVKMLWAEQPICRSYIFRVM